MPGPSFIVTTLNDLVNPVIIKVENRTTDTARAIEWICDAILEITSNTRLRNDFDELEVLNTPLFNLTVGQQEYPDTSFMPPTAVGSMSNINMATLDIRIWEDPPNNTIFKRLDQSNYQETDKFVTAVESIPAVFYRYGSNIGFYPVPDKTYQTQMRALQYYPFNTSALGTTPFILSQDWALPIKLMAAEIGFLELEEPGKAAGLHQSLHGDPKNPDAPGLLYSRKLRREKENWRQEQRLMPVVRDYSFGRRV